MNLRDYQAKAIELLYKYFAHNNGNPVLEAPTAAGKSVIQAGFISGVIEQWEDQRILCLTHVRELVEQNCEKMRAAWPDGSIGIYSAALNSRDTEHSVIFASIQSVYKRAHELGRFDLVLVDECHLIPSDTSKGMYRKFLDASRQFNPRLKVIGFSATPYRLGNGLLIEGEDRLFTDLIPAKAAGMSIDDLLRDGYLAPLTTAPVQTALDVTGVRIRGGEYSAKDLALAVDVDATTRAACEEIMRFGADRRAFLVFASSIEHAYHIAECLYGHGVSVEVVTGTTPADERERIIAEYKAGSLKALVNVNVLTTGFDAPHTDLLAFLRPTMSTSLYVQMSGRGMRIAPGKDDCLVLDFAGLIETHGPVNKVNPPRRRKKSDNAVPPVKECPKCLFLVPAAARECLYCKEPFHFDTSPNISSTPSALDILQTNKPRKVVPTRMEFSVHQKPGKPDSIRVDYYDGLLKVVSEWLCPLHGGMAQKTAFSWMEKYTRVPSVIIDGTDKPTKSLEWMLAGYRESIDVIKDLAKILPTYAVLPQYIYITTTGKYPEIISRGFEDEAA